MYFMGVDSNTFVFHLLRIYILVNSAIKAMTVGNIYTVLNTNNVILQNKKFIFCD